MLRTCGIRELTKNPATATAVLRKIAELISDGVARQITRTGARCIRLTFLFFCFSRVQTQNYDFYVITGNDRLMRPIWLVKFTTIVTDILPCCI
jgi:hypothetical protein